jgi:hypothetical protein
MSIDTSLEKRTKRVKKLIETRDMAAIAEWEFQNFLIGAKLQVQAQYGVSSNEVQSLGLKKKSEYKLATGSKKADEGALYNISFNRQSNS